MNSVNMKKFSLILASESPRRRELLGHSGLNFQSIALDIDEHSSKVEPREFALDIASQKLSAARSWAKNNVSQERYHPFLVCSDTLVTIDGKILGKPKDKKDAARILKILSGRSHKVFTSVGMCWSVAGEWKDYHFIDSAEVEFDEIDAPTLEHYISTGESLDKAGAYGIQGPALVFIKRLCGSYSTVMGFPLSLFMLEMKKIMRSYCQTENIGPECWRDLFV